MLQKILKNFNAFVDGRGYAGRIDEISLPKLSIKTEEHRAGGMDIPVAIDRCYDYYTKIIPEANNQLSSSILAMQYYVEQKPFLSMAKLLVHT